MAVNIYLQADRQRGAVEPSSGMAVLSGTISWPADDGRSQIQPPTVRSGTAYTHPVNGDITMCRAGLLRGGWTLSCCDPARDLWRWDEWPKEGGETVSGRARGVVVHNKCGPEGGLACWGLIGLKSHRTLLGPASGPCASAPPPPPFPCDLGLGSQRRCYRP
ncbi:hypothetical protein NDU88_002557 [Pleurodeles waltl]|uniref:Uncharacterized protein n=1 Tax=Pleurodeles waltl TaxID=8319 RepID=A0AAV7TLI9_PLEWA|nr:hypothetical protein NDU88_002557 [Pleurodeles waltl]